MLNRLAEAQSPAAGTANSAYAAAVRHTRRVERLKVLLPIAAILISLSFIAVSVIRAYLPENIELEGARIENGKVVMEKPAISGRNRDGISYSMRAERALQDIANPNIITLETIAAAVPLNEKVIARVEAISGIFDRSSDRLDMTAPFTIRLSSGVEANFQSAHLDVKGGKMETPDPVSIKAEQAAIVADSMKITDNGRTIVFSGAVRVNIEPSAIRKQGN
ncbi:LPS export ABC transporter periplasmic protein LptC [Ciceribacter sp. L1K23]|uniref:LPS export ABC transporter periplasmic protein LptC n=1 Tax=Ciceribacter sp. L1K23 TaxID=2820276 RepID=UPI001B842407|nr:LPS export ABC transporter periplasmic protein LptC [Ciceribacter sp. L1K23]MBR0557202.1 LPS export ABC transporter periplasmic protein LptC [Ciceribacter sp. L1K23]